MLDFISPAPPAPVLTGALTESHAIDIWIARWLHVRRKDILARYGCDPRRLYDIWEGRKFPSSRDKALSVFVERYPSLNGGSDTSFHRRIPRPGPVPGQPMLFAELPEMSCGKRRR
jgi:hypothetical protein